MRHLPVLLPLIVVFAIGCGGSGDSGKGAGSSGGKGFAQKVLDADPTLFTGANVRSHKNVVKDFTPKYPAGTKADAIQAITMLTPPHTTNNPPQFIRHNEGVSANIGLRCNPALWNAVFGHPENVKTNRLNKEWLIRCTDGDIRCVGDILGDRYFVDLVFKE